MVVPSHLVARRSGWNRKLRGTSRCDVEADTNRPIDSLSAYHFASTDAKIKASSATSQPTRYAVRQVLDQELRKARTTQASQARASRDGGPKRQLTTTRSLDGQDDKENDDPSSKGLRTAKIKRDFFGRPIAISELSEASETVSRNLDASSIAKRTASKGKAQNPSDGAGDTRIWVSFSEGFSNAVRKPITMSDLLTDL